MVLTRVFVRFYKSFNFDYLRKHHRNARPNPWEMIGDLWYPFVEVPIESDITTVVGANESGKSHLLTAIEKGISGKGICRQDFCRYSTFFTVEQGKMRGPDFGFEWTKLTEAEARAVRTACGLPEASPIKSLLLFRFNQSVWTAFIAEDSGEFKKCALSSENAVALDSVLPMTFRIDADVALPSSVPIKWLAADDEFKPETYEALGRERRFGLFDAVLKGSTWFGSAEAVKQSAPEITATFGPFTNAIKIDEREQCQQQAEYKLARDLICKVAKIDKAALHDLHAAIRAGNDGHANGIIQQINASLATALNFPKWWAQDRDFRLTVSAREHDLVFTIRDRTETEYSFGERSSGLKYFLSYYVQYLAHEQPLNRREILLMDEPDAYLSSQAQQDLLKVFAAFAGKDDGRPEVQVLYVTHSPFLIDKNHAARIRVLEKGSGDEGTRVIRNASKNHYEPLRSAFGAFVGETVFIGNCNLMVEGASDQILLAGAATVLQRLGASNYETLDLNKITIVPTGAASHVPYMIYLARGRDVEQPAVLVLLDSDDAGNFARKEIKRGGPRGKQLLKPEFVLQVGELAEKLPVVPSTASSLSEIEDLIPLPICVEAARKYMREYCERQDVAGRVTTKAVADAIRNGQSIFKAIERVFSEIGPDLHLDKIGFARAVCETVADLLDKEPNGEPLKHYVASMKVLFREICGMQRKAIKELTAEKVGRRVDRARDSFLKDHPSGARREEAAPLLEDIERALDDSPEADAIKTLLQQIRREFSLGEDMTQPVADYQRFRKELEQIRYAGTLSVDDASISSLIVSKDATASQSRDTAIVPT